jgi:hypothetical protein
MQSYPDATASADRNQLVHGFRDQKCCYCDHQSYCITATGCHCSWRGTGCSDSCHCNPQRCSMLPPGTVVPHVIPLPQRDLVHPLDVRPPPSPPTRGPESTSVADATKNDCADDRNACIESGHQHSEPEAPTGDTPAIRTSTNAASTSSEPANTEGSPGERSPNSSLGCRYSKPAQFLRDQLSVNRSPRRIKSEGDVGFIPIDRAQGHGVRAAEVNTGALTGPQSIAAQLPKPQRTISRGFTGETCRLSNTASGCDMNRHILTPGWDAAIDLSQAHRANLFQPPSPTRNKRMIHSTVSATTVARSGWSNPPIAEGRLAESSLQSGLSLECRYSSAARSLRRQLSAKPSPFGIITEDHSAPTGDTQSLVRPTKLLPFQPRCGEILPIGIEAGHHWALAKGKSSGLSWPVERPFLNIYPDNPGDFKP